jgi:ankyrin repeat protein
MLIDPPCLRLVQIRHSGETPFTSACHFGHVDAARLLRAARPDLDVNHVPPFNGSLATALNGAIAAGHAAVVRYLLLEVQPPAVFIAGPEGPVLTAASLGFTEILQIILEAAPAVSLTAVDADGRSALVLAALGGHADAVTVLLQHRQWRVPAAELAQARDAANQHPYDHVMRALQNATETIATVATAIADHTANASEVASTGEKTEL